MVAKRKTKTRVQKKTAKKKAAKRKAPAAKKKAKTAPAKNRKKAKPRGRPRIELDKVQLENLAAIHCTMEEIAAVMGCSVDTLERNYADSIKKGREIGNMSLRRMQFQAAKGGNPAMLIWLGKQHLGQKDRIVEEQKRTITHVTRRIVDPADQDDFDE